MINKMGLTRPQERFGNSSLLIKPLVVLAMALVGAVLVEAATLFGAPFSSVFEPSDWCKKRILISWVSLSIILAYFAYFRPSRSKKRRAQRDCGEAGRAVLYSTLVFVVVLVLVRGVGFLLGLSLTMARCSLVALVGFAVAIVVLQRNAIGEEPEKVFVPIAIVLAIVVSALMPVATGVSWDDQIHYDRTLAVSYLISPEYTEADAKMLTPPYEEYGDGAVLFRQTEEDYSAYLGELQTLSGVLYRKCWGAESVDGCGTISLVSIGYMPAAFGLWLGRFLHLPFFLVFVLGRIANAMLFLALVYDGVRRLKAGKLLVLSFALLPTVIFLASNYSYDAVVFGLISYGFLRMASWLQNDQLVLTAREAAVPPLAMAVGCCPKAIYFPVLFLLLFLPKRLFPSRGFRRGYNIGVVLLILALMSTFVLPILIGGAGSGDSRGGEGVNSAGQISWILANPVDFVCVIGNYLVEYLSPSYSAEYTSHLAYMAVPTLGAVPLVALLCISLIDSNPCAFELAKLRYKVLGALLLVGTAFLVASALYVSFTSVGRETVAGCQGRYLLPLLIPALTLVANAKLDYKGSGFALGIGSLVLFGCFDLYCFGSVLIPLYL